MKIKIILILIASISLSCGNTKKLKNTEAETTTKSKSESQIKLGDNDGIERAYEIIGYLKDKDLKKIKNSFFEPIAAKVSDDVLKKIAVKASELISEFGIPGKEQVMQQIKFTQINLPEITKETNVQLLEYAFPMPADNTKPIPLKSIKITFLPSEGYSKVIGISVVDNSNIREVEPDFEKLSSFNFNLNEFKKVRIGNQNKEGYKSLDKKISELSSQHITSINKVLKLINTAEIEKTEIAYDIIRYNGNPETISLQLNPYDRIMMPHETTEPYFMISEILDTISEEKESEWIIISHFKILNSQYIYYLSKSGNLELYNELKKLKKYTL